MAYMLIVDFKRFPGLKLRGFSKVGRYDIIEFQSMYKLSVSLSLKASYTILKNVKKK